MPTTLTPFLKSKTEGPGIPMNAKGTMERAKMVVPSVTVLEPKGNACSVELHAMAAPGEDTSEASLAELLRCHMLNPHMDHQVLPFQY